MTAITQNQFNPIIKGTTSLIPSAKTFALTVAKVTTSVLKTAAAIASVTGIAYMDFRWNARPNFAPALNWKEDNNAIALLPHVINQLPDATKLSLAQAYPGDPVIQKACKDVVRLHRQSQLTSLKNNLNIKEALFMGSLTQMLLETTLALKIIAKASPSAILVPPIALAGISYSSVPFLKWMAPHSDTWSGERLFSLASLISGKTLLALALAIRLRSQNMPEMKQLLSQFLKESIKTTFLSAFASICCDLLKLKATSSEQHNNLNALACYTSVALGLKNSAEFQWASRMIAGFFRSRS